MLATPNLPKEIKRQGRQMQTLAELVELTPAQFSHVVNGRRELDWVRASKIAAALGWPLFFLFELPVGSKDDPVGITDDRGVA